MIRDIPSRIINILSNPQITNSPHWEDDEGLAHVSMANDCARQIYYKIKYPKFWPTVPILAGMLVDIWIKAAITQIEGYETNVFVDFRPEYPVIGEADIVSAQEVNDLKTTSEKSLDYKRTEGASKYHIEQVNLYAYGLKRDWCSITYISRDYFRIWSYSWATDPEMAIKSLNRLKALHSLTVENGMLPETITGEGKKLVPHEKLWECRFCNYTYKCMRKEK